MKAATSGAKLAGLPPPWPRTGWPKIRVTGAQRLEASGQTRRFLLRLRLENGCRPDVLLYVSPNAGAQVLLPTEWPNRDDWAPEILATIRRSWPLLLAGAPPAPEEATLPPLRQVGRPRLLSR